MAQSSTGQSLPGGPAADREPCAATRAPIVEQRFVSDGVTAGVAGGATTKFA